MSHTASRRLSACLCFSAFRERRGRGNIRGRSDVSHCQQGYLSIIRGMACLCLGAYRKGGEGGILGGGHSHGVKVLA